MSKAKEPTRAQLSSRLAYSSQTPAFLLKLQRKIAGQQDEDEDEPQYEDFEDDGSGRPPIPRRPAIPERPAEDPGSADEDDGDEAPQIVVLREGKHLSEREVENEKRKAKGLPPLPENIAADDKDSSSASASTSSKPATEKQQALSFSSSGSRSSGAKKRKAVGDGKDDEKQRRHEGDKKKGGSTAPSKKPKKAEKKLLSFDEDA
ncbi:hypothetical protein BXZ70DRAFT_1071446 [Cristinia sonorae]|uniref:DUF4604 domain-containing protein n=1 Tax=Cristinia sonorae TaxID=1940300 RepID=A0A8K0XQ53_9AGAR|nr:hypothetical protein BXZ70DRAFT_1071446 [Cristinia sonorae]